MKKIFTEMIQQFVELLMKNQVQFNRENLNTQVLNDILPAVDKDYSLIDKPQSNLILKYSNNILILRDQLSDETDIKKTLSDASTQLVFQHLFTDDTYSKFINYFYNILSFAISKYKNAISIKQKRNYIIPNDLCVVYKGGNLYYDLALPYIQKMDCEQKQSIEDQIKRTDADLSIWINIQKFKQQKKVQNDIQKLSIFCLQLFRLFAQDQVNNFLPHNSSIAQTIWNQYEFYLKSSHPTYHIDKIHFNNFIIHRSQSGQISIQETKKVPKKPDSYLESIYPSQNDIHPKLPMSDLQKYKILVQLTGYNQGPRSTSLILTPQPIVENKCPCQIFLSQNHVQFFKNNQTQSFFLIRAKLNIQITVVQNQKKQNISIPSELFDISIPLLDDSCHQYNLQQKFSNVIQRKSISISKFFQDQKHPMYVYSPKSLIHDIEFILFFYYQYPWEDPKFQKRLFRYLLINFIFMLQSLSNPNDIKIIIDLFLAFLLNPTLKNKKILIDAKLEDTFTVFIQQYYLFYKQLKKKTSPDDRRKLLIMKKSILFLTTIFSQCFLEHK